MSLQRHRQDGKGHYYMFTNAGNGLNASFYIEPAEKCATAEACRETYWRNRSAVLAEPQLMGRFERNGFALLEFVIGVRVPDLPGQTVEQLNLSGHLVRDGYWVDIHLSKMPSTLSDRQTFLDFVDSIVVQPKAP